MTTSNLNPITAFSNGIMPLTDAAKAWADARDAVDYPVEIVQLFYKKPDEQFEPAIGDTKTGRETQFYGVAVDRDRSGNVQIIATVTGTYGTLVAKDVYSDLEKDLIENNLNARPTSVYVSGNGGRALLHVAIDGREVQVGSDKIKTRFSLDTSIDGTKKHTLRLVVADEDGVELVGMGEKTFNIGTKHTKTIGERHIAFQTVLVRLAKEWEENIEPMLDIMNDCVFDRKMAIDIFEQIMQNAEIPERHIKNALASFTPTGDQSMYNVLKGISSYLHGALNNKPERLEDFHEKINKKSRKLIEQTIQQFRKN